MNQPTIEQFEKLQNTVFELSSKLEQLDLMETKRNFTIHDSSVKIGIAEGLASSTHHSISKLEYKLEHEMVQLKAEMKELRESNDQQLDVFRQQMNQQSTLLKEILARLS